MLEGQRLIGPGEGKFRHSAPKLGHDALRGFGADVREFLQECRIAAFNGLGNFVQRSHQTLQSLHKADARYGRESFEKFAVKRIEKSHQFGSEMAAAQTPINVVDGIQSYWVRLLALGGLA